MRKLWLLLLLAIGGACGHAQAPPQANVLTYCTASNGTIAICPSNTPGAITTLYPQGAVVTYCLTTGGAIVPCPPATSGGSGTVTSVAIGTGWPTWLTPSVTNSTSNATVNATALSIPNSALTSSSTTVNGQACVLGGTCTISVGIGTVTGFSSGNLSPLFTTSVATSTTTPAQTFTASTAAQNFALAGPATGGTGAYSFRALVAADIPSLAYIPTTSAPAGTIVGTTDTQTLTNKVLAPTNTLTGDVTSTPSVSQLITSTNSGFTTNIPAGNVCWITQVFISGTNYDAEASCSTSAPGHQWYFSSGHALNSPVWATNQTMSGSMFTTTTPLSATSYSGSGTATFAAGAAAGTSPPAPTCATSHVCDTVSGEITLTTGTAPPLPPGTLLTITLPVTRANIPNCTVSMIITGTGLEPNIQWTETTTTIVISLEGSTNLGASTVYPVRYICGGK